MADLDLDAIEERAKAATQGPWNPNGYSRIDSTPLLRQHIDNGDVDCPRCTDRVDCYVVGHVQAAYGDTAYRWDDAVFVAHAREDIPALVARVRELERELRDNTNDYIESCFNMSVRHDREIEALQARVRELEANVEELERRIVDAISTGTEYALRQIESRIALVRDVSEADRRVNGSVANQSTQEKKT